MTRLNPPVRIRREFDPVLQMHIWVVNETVKPTDWPHWFYDWSSALAFANRYAFMIRMARAMEGLA